MQGIRQLLGTGVKRVSAHQLMLLDGAPLSNPDSRERFGLKTRFRVVARNLGVYAAEAIIETEEMVVETSTFSFQDYLDARVFHLLLTIFYYEGNFEEAFEFARQEGISAFDLITRLQAMLDAAPPDFRNVINDFVRESQEELFDSERECLEWARRNFDGLLSGDLGGNLLSKYSMLGRFYVTQASLGFLESGIAAALGETGMAAEPMGALQTVINYLRCALLHARFSETLAMNPRFRARYDVEAWRQEGYKKPLTAYAHPNILTYRTVVDPERRALIESRIATFGEHPTGLGKFTRTMFARDLRRTFVLDERRHTPLTSGMMPRIMSPSGLK
jgi:hypothetical protein